MTALLIISHTAALGAGAYLWYRFGTRVAADANVIKSKL